MNGDFVILGGGKSLNRADVDYCRGRAKVIAINTAYQIAPWADYMYARDYDWWRATPREVFRANCAAGWTAIANGPNPHYVLAHQMFQGQRWTGSSKAAGEFGLLSVDTRSIGGLCAIPGVIHEGSAGGANSGHQAVNLAINQFHAKRIFLLGFDMLGGHWHGDHPAPLTNLSDSQFQPFADSFATMLKPLADLGVEVVNCAPKSRITCFRFSTIQAELPN